MDDLISRQAAIEAIDAVFPVDPMKSEFAQGIACGAALAKTYVEQQPSAQQWIPCSERMPEEYEEVWITLRGSDMIVCKDGETLEEAAERVWKENIRVSIGFYGSDGWYGIDGYPSMISPVAWMPMNEPEPYKGDEDYG